MLSKKKTGYGRIRKSPYKFIVKRSHSGLGLYAVDAIPKNRFVIEYFGPLLTDAEADRRGGKYLFAINSKWTIDGTPRNNVARYINHDCRPNCEVYYVGKRVMIRSIKNIKPGQELTYDYDTEYFNGIIGGKWRCRCGKCKAYRSEYRRNKK